jgi:hypothetical protein
MKREKIEFLYPRADMLPAEFLPRRASSSDYEWFLQTPPMADTCDGRRVTTVRVCPGLQDSMTLGFIIPMPCDLEFRIAFLPDGTPDIKTNFGNRDLIANVVSHPAIQYKALLDEEGHSWLNIKINTKIVVQSSGNVNMLYVKPLYHDNPMFEAIAGTVDHTCQHQLHFNLKWKSKKPGTYFIKAGTPMLQAIPVPRERMADFSIRQPDETEMRDINSRFSKLLMRGDYRARQKRQYDKTGQSRCPVTRSKSIFNRIVDTILRRKGTPI